ncbi:hypothetical protein ACFQV8_02485 [Pseudonocardia benzenivorans]
MASLHSSRGRGSVRQGLATVIGSVVVIVLLSASLSPLVSPPASVPGPVQGLDVAPAEPELVEPLRTVTEPARQRVSEVRAHLELVGSVGRARVGRGGEDRPGRHVHHDHAAFGHPARVLGTGEHDPRRARLESAGDELFDPALVLPGSDLPEPDTAGDAREQLGGDVDGREGERRDERVGVGRRGQQGRGIVAPVPQDDEEPPDHLDHPRGGGRFGDQDGKEPLLGIAPLRPGDVQCRVDVHGRPFWSAPGAARSDSPRRRDRTCRSRLRGRAV